MSVNLFEVESPLGYRVICSKNTWNNHIIAEHRIMKDKENVVMAAISNPVAIFQSNSHDDRDVYFGDFLHNTDKNLYTKVIVSNEDIGHSVITAFPQENMSGNIRSEVLKYVKPKLQ